MPAALLIEIDDPTVARLQEEAAATGETIEALARRLLNVAVEDLANLGTGSLLSPDQQRDLDQRLADPGPVATPEEAQRFFDRLLRT